VNRGRLHVHVDDEGGERVVVEDGERVGVREGLGDGDRFQGLGFLFVCLDVIEGNAIVAANEEVEIISKGKGKRHDFVRLRKGELHLFCL